MLAAVSIAALDWLTTLTRLSAVVAFLAGILLSVACARLAALRQWPLLVAAFVGELVLIAAGSLMLVSNATVGTETFVLCLSLALGLQNGAFRRVGGISIHTTYLTGMLTGLMVTESEKLFSQPPSAATRQDERARLLYRIWISFFVGAATGAALVLRFKEAGMLVLVIVLMVLIVRTLLSQPSFPGELSGSQGYQVTARAGDRNISGRKEE
jgi:uncharacterized membrane protein YoaK (UPF0700 family)